MSRLLKGFASLAEDGRSVVFGIFNDAVIVQKETTEEGSGGTEGEDGRAEDDGESGFGVSALEVVVEGIVVFLGVLYGEGELFLLGLEEGAFGAGFSLLGAEGVEGLRVGVETLFEVLAVVPVVLSKAEESDVDLALADEDIGVAFEAERGLKDDLGLEVVAGGESGVEGVVLAEVVEGFLKGLDAGIEALDVFLEGGEGAKVAGIEDRGEGTFHLEAEEVEMKLPKVELGAVGFGERGAEALVEVGEALEGRAEGGEVSEGEGFAGFAEEVGEFSRGLRGGESEGPTEQEEERQEEKAEPKDPGVV